MKRNHRQYYRPILGTDIWSHTTLMIRSLHGKQFQVFVGGLYVGHTRTLATAKALLLASAKARCLRRIVAAEDELQQYRKQLCRFWAEGLVRGRRS